VGRGRRVEEGWVGVGGGGEGGERWDSSTFAMQSRTGSTTKGESGKAREKTLFIKNNTFHQI